VKMEVVFGIGIGAAVTLVICTWLNQREHAAWMEMADRYEDVIERLQAGQRSDADWWKQN